jgi:thiol-disulfide isomerase/thioredoxin
MKKIILFILIISPSCNLETPKEFNEKSYKERLFSVDDSSTTFKEILNSYKGKKVLIDVWASWCRDCIKGMPSVKKLQTEFPEVVFLFLSVDERKNSWKRGITKYRLVGEHYNLPKGMKNGDFVDFLNLGWIPRYLVIDEQGKILVFNATKASDKRIIEALRK